MSVTRNVLEAIGNNAKSIVALAGRAKELEARLASAEQAILVLDRRLTSVSLEAGQLRAEINHFYGDE